MIKSDDDNAFQVSEQFSKDGCLDSQSMLFTNNVGMFLVKNRKEIYDCVAEMIHSAQMCTECLPEDSKIMVQGLQFNLTLKKPIDDKAIAHLEGYGFTFQYETYSINDAGEDIAISTFFYQLPENFDDTFNEFLKTYPNFLTKKNQERLTEKGKRGL